MSGLYAVENLLRSIYQPQNHHCIHVDKTSSEYFKSGISNITKCFSNIFESSRQIDVIYENWNLDMVKSIHFIAFFYTFF